MKEVVVDLKHSAKLIISRIREILIRLCRAYLSIVTLFRSMIGVGVIQHAELDCRTRNFGG